MLVGGTALGALTGRYSAEGFLASATALLLGGEALAFRHLRRTVRARRDRPPPPDPSP